MVLSQLSQPFQIKRVQTDNGAELHKRFRDDNLEKKGIIQFFNYPRRPQMNAQIERFNTTIQEDFINWNLNLLDTNISRSLTKKLIGCGIIPKDLILLWIIKVHYNT